MWGGFGHGNILFSELFRISRNKGCRWKVLPWVHYSYVISRRTRVHLPAVYVYRAVHFKPCRGWDCIPCWSSRRVWYPWQRWRAWVSFCLSHRRASSVGRQHCGWSPNHTTALLLQNHIPDSVREGEMRGAEGKEGSWGKERGGGRGRGRGKGKGVGVGGREGGGEGGEGEGWQRGREGGKGRGKRTM